MSTATRTAVSAGLRARAGLLAVSGGAMLWGTTGLGVSIVHERVGLTAVPIAFLRSVVAVVAMGGIAVATGGLRRHRAVVRQRPVAVLVAGTGLALYQALYFVGIQDIGVSVSTLVSLAAAPVALTVAAAIEHRRVPDALRLLTLVAALTGLALVCARPGSSAGGPHAVVGVLASIGSGLFYAATTMLNRSLARSADPLPLTGLTSVVGAVVLAPFAVLSGPGVFWPADGISSAWLVYIGVVSTCVAYGLFYLGLRTVTSEIAGMLTLLEPLTAAVLAALVLREQLSAAGWAGAVLLLAAVGALYLRQPDEPPAALAEPPGA